MAARAMWKGVLKLGDVKLGVKLYAAVQDRDVHFTLLAPKSRTPVHQQMVKPDDGEVVPYAEIRKGYETEGTFVVLDKEELTKLAPKPSRDIEVESFVTPQKLGPEWFVRPYYLGPDGDVEHYTALAQALHESEREGIAHWVMRGQEYTGALRSDGKVLSLITLRHADELVDIGALPEAEGRAHSDKEAKMAEQLISAYEGEFDPKEFVNEHRDRVMQLIDMKASGKRPRLKPVREKKAETSLVSALEKSLAHAKKQSGDGASERQASRKPRRATRSTRAKERHVA
jgi:DNA end-binding protein Ku